MAGFKPTSLSRVGSVFSARYGALWVAVFANVFLAILYIWSRGGGVVHLRIETDGSAYRAFVDGRQIASPNFRGVSPNRLAFGIPEKKDIPTLPGPAGIDLVRVTDRNTGEVVFEDTFDSWQPELWRLDAGEALVEDGVFSTGPSFASVSTNISDWDSHTIEAQFRNLTRASLTLRQGRDVLSFNIWPFAIYQSRVDRLDDSGLVGRFGGADLELDRRQTLKSITAMLLRPYPIILLIVAGVTVFAFAVRLPSLDRRVQSVGQLILARADLVVLGLAAAALALLWYLIYVVGEAMPHVPDSAAYIFQAKIFASFRTATEVPPVLRSFSFSAPSAMQVVDDRWFSQYPFGHPLFLAIGEVFRIVWLVPPILGAASTFLIYRIGRHVYGTSVGALAALLLLFSPFFQMTASNFMSHNTAAFVILLCLFLYVRPTRRRLLSMLASGILLGLLFNIRPLTAVAFMPALAGLFAYDLIHATDDRASLFRAYLAFAVGSVLLLGAYFLYNQVTTGDLLTSGYALTNTYSGDSIGFDGEHSVARGLQNIQELLAYMLLVAHGWPAAIGLSLAALPFILGTRHRWDYFLAASALSLAAAVILYRNAAVMHGPRFWYETMPFLMLLTARGVQRLWEVSLAMSDWLASRLGRKNQTTPGGLVGVVLVCFVAGLIAFSAYGWMLGKRDAWSGVPSVPQKMSMLEGFNHADRRLLERADELGLKNALVLVEDCPQWWCYGSVFWANSPDLDGDIVWAERSSPALDSFLIDSFEDRALYLADYDAGAIEPATRADIEPEAPPP